MKDNLEKLFQDINFDTEEPQKGHEERFLQKLEQQQKKSKGKVFYLNVLTPIASIAACLLVAFLVFNQNLNFNKPNGELASVSPEMEKTQQFYTAVIQTELEKLASEKTPETEAIFNDAIKQLEILEKDHEKLKKDLVKSGNDKRVIFAMINNYQQRIELLQEVLQKIDKIKNLKNPRHESNII